MCYIIILYIFKIELFTHYNYMSNIINKLCKINDLRLCGVHLVDSYYCRYFTTLRFIIKQLHTIYTNTYLHIYTSI
jgi:hypothetical protein